MISSRTPEGCPHHCPICGQDLQIEPSTVPVRDAPCPYCGCLLSFPDQHVTKLKFSTADLADMLVQLGDSPDEAGPRELQLDFSDLTFLTSKALGLLITLLVNTSASGGRLVLCNVNPEIREVFEITRLDRKLTFRDG
jgi:anti-anti-sigma factor